MKHATRLRQERFAKSFNGLQGLDWSAALDRLLASTKKLGIVRCAHAETPVFARAA